MSSSSMSPLSRPTPKRPHSRHQKKASGSTCRSHTSRTNRRLPLFAVLFLITVFFSQPTYAIKFILQAHRYPPAKCVWNTAHANQLVIVTANVAPGEGQRVDIEIVDSSTQKNQYLSKRGVKGETRMAVTAHTDGEVGVCFKNYLEVGTDPSFTQTRTIDLDVDIGADAVDYNAIANQESLSALETEMRKLEGIVNEIVDELNYLKTREERFTGTNESTNKRVQSFGLFTFVALVALGIWQILHLRSFFKRKYLID